MILTHTTRRVAAASLAAAAVALLAGCASGGSPGGDSGTSTASDITLAAVLPNTSDPFFATISCAAQAEAQSRGVQLTTYNSTNTDANTIATNFQTATLADPDGILVTPFNNNQFIAQYQKLMQSGVPVVTGSGTDPQAEYKAIYSDTDTGPLAADIADLIPSGDGSMVFLGGAPGIPPLEQRTQPFVDAVQQANPQLTALPTDYSGFDVNKSTTSVSALILAHPDLKLIIAADGPDGLGAAAAISQAGKAGQIALVAFDAVPGEVDALKAGTISALIAQNPTEIGQKSVDALVDYLQAHPDGGPVSPDGTEAVANKVLTKDTVDAPENAGFLYSAGC
jgi:ribose transport system substrate-binding protein